MGLNREQAEVIATMEPRRAVVHYAQHPTPFQVEIPEISFPAKPKETRLRRESEELLSKTHWSEHEQDRTTKTPAAAKILAPDDLAGDALLVMVRICQEPAEPIEQRCEKLQMDRPREFRARAELDGRGLIHQVKQTIGGKTKFFEPTSKGIEWAQKRNIHVKKFKSGIVHEYLLCQVERRIGQIGSQWRLQRNSSVGRDQGLQPDLLVLGPDGKRIIIEICCSNFDYDARNVLIEAGIPGIDLVVAITPDKGSLKSLTKTLTNNAELFSGNWQESVVTLDPAQCLSDEFDWAAILVNPNRKNPSN
jgi:hypothetical protein